MKGVLKSRGGYTVLELLLVAGIITSIPVGAYIGAKNMALEIKCLNNLKQIGMAIEMFCMETGRFPEAVFFPENPNTDRKSIKVILSSGASGEVFICPVAPKPLKKAGLTYLWNDLCSGKERRKVRGAAKTWLVTDINAVKEILEEDNGDKGLREKLEKIPPAHRGGYNVLYVDGHVSWSKHVE